MTAFTRSSVSSTASAATSATSSVLRQVVAPLAALALTALLGTTAQAQGTSATPAVTPAATPSAAAAPASTPALNIRQIYDRLDAAGYRDLREIEWDDYHYEVKGRDAQGARVKLDVDGHTGAVLRSRRR